MTTGKSIAIIQSNYIPWKGYFDIIDRVDEFVLLDDTQFTKRDWRNRNKIKTPQGLKWLTVPVTTKGRYEQAIDETEISEPWAEKHWESLRHAYGKSPCFAAEAGWLEDVYREASDCRFLSDVNRLFIERINERLGIDTKLTSSRSYDPSGAKSERLIGLCVAAGATRYLSGPAAKDYLDEAAFAEQGVAVEWMDYGGYPEYPQLHGTFEHGVTILDMLFMLGDNTRHFMRHGLTGRLKAPR